MLPPLLLLVGCPQLLDDDFVTHSPAGNGAAGTTGDGAPGSAGNGAGALGGSSGRGEPSAGAGQAGSSTSSGDAGTGGSAEPDAGSSDPSSVAPDWTATLLHRYQFNTPGSVVEDSVGAADGNAIGAVVGVDGQIFLSGDGEYVDLPDGLISGLASVTIEAWVNWQGNPESPATDWVTVCSFGMNSGGVDARGTDGESYLNLLAKSGFSNRLVGAFSVQNYQDEIRTHGPGPLPAANGDEGTHIALTANGDTNALALYLNGVRVQDPDDDVLGAVDLSRLDDRNNWIGRSWYNLAGDFEGNILELRIYGEALNATEVATSFARGPDAKL